MTFSYPARYELGGCQSQIVQVVGTAKRDVERIRDIKIVCDDVEYWGCTDGTVGIVAFLLDCKIDSRKTIVLESQPQYSHGAVCFSDEMKVNSLSHNSLNDWNWTRWCNTYRVGKNAG